MNQLRLINDKLLLEYFVYATSYYQCNPKKFKNPDVFINVIQRTVGEQWKRDEIKIAAYKRNGYELVKQTNPKLLKGYKKP